MRALIGCEESGKVRQAFRRVGVDAFSCDLVPARDGCSEFHLQKDLLKAIEEDGPWHLLIAFPPCTHLAVSGARWFAEKRAQGLQDEALAFVRKIMAAKIPRIAIENPVSVISTAIRPPDQVIQPWQFGHGEQKTTCLWLKNLPLLVPTKIVEGRVQRVYKMGPSPTRARDRSETYDGIATAMAEQWGKETPYQRSLFG